MTVITGRPINYTTGGEKKRNVEFTVELREWLQQFHQIGILFFDTLDTMRLITVHDAGQIMGCFENYSIYTYDESSLTPDDGNNVIRPINVDNLSSGRWLLRARFDGGSIELKFFDSFSLFPEEGNPNWLYIDKQYSRLYRWNVTTEEYLPITTSYASDAGTLAGQQPSFYKDVIQVNSLPLSSQITTVIYELLQQDGTKAPYTLWAWDGADWQSVGGLVEETDPIFQAWLADADIVESVTSTDNHIVVDNTDPANPSLSFQLVDNENLLTDDELAIVQNTSGTNTGDQVADGVTITGDGSVEDPFVAVQQDLTGLFVKQISNGCHSIPTITNNNNGTVTIGAFEATVNPLASGDGISKRYTITGATLSLNDLVSNYIMVNYNSGTPILTVGQDVTVINETTIIPVFSIFRNGNYLHTQNWDSLGNALANKVHQSIVKTQRYRRESGLSLSEFGTRKLALTSGRIWTGAVPIDLSAIDTTTDSIYEWYKASGVWTQRLVTAYNNIQYQNGDDLSTLSNGRYAVNWIFRGVETEKHLYCVYGNGNYTQAQAISAVVPSPPSTISSHAVLVSKVIVLKNASTAYSIQSAFDTQFSYATVVDHRDLTNINGDTIYQHVDTTTFKTTPVDADSVALNDSVTSKVVLWTIANVKAFLDTIYSKIFSHTTTSASSGTISLAPNTETTLSTTLTNSHTITITPTAPNVFTQSWDAVINLTIGASLPTITITAPSGVTFVWRKSSTVDFAINKSKTLHFIWISSTRCDVIYSDNY